MKMENWFWILGWFLSILTMTWNGVIIFLVFSRRHLRTKTNTFVVSLAVADFFVGANVIPSMFFLERTGRNYSLHRGLMVIKWLFLDASVMNMCSLVLDRYLAVVKPFKYLTLMTSGRVILLSSFSWGVSVAFILVESFLLFSLNTTVALHTLHLLAFVLFYLFPCLMITFCFASMLRVICKQNQVATFLGRQLRCNKRREKSALIMMTIVVSLFLVFCGLNIRCIFAVIVNDKCDRGKYRDLILVLNSAVNPLAYAFFKEDLKREINKLFCKVTSRNGNNRVEPCNKKSSRSILASSTL